MNYDQNSEVGSWPSVIGWQFLDKSFSGLCSGAVLAFAILVGTGSLAAHQASIVKCNAVAYGQGWNTNELFVWDNICRSKVADLSKRPDDREVSSEFLRSIVTLKCYRDWIGPQGIRIRNAQFVGNSSTSDNGEAIDHCKATEDGVVSDCTDLSDTQFPWPLQITASVFGSLVLARTRSNQDLILDNNKIKYLFDVSDSDIDGNLSLDCLQGDPQANLARIVVGGQVSLNGVELNELDLSWSTIGVKHSSGSTLLDKTLSESIIYDPVTAFAVDPQLVGSRSASAASKNPQRGLSLRNGAIRSKLSLAGTTVHGMLSINSNKDNRSIPHNVYLNGLRYDSINFDTRGTEYKAYTVPQWIHQRFLQASPELIDRNMEFSLQPYLQFAAAARAEGAPLVADAILFEGKRKEVTRTDGHTMSTWILEQFTGYGVGIGAVYALIQFLLIMIITGTILTAFAKNFIRWSIAITSRYNEVVFGLSTYRREAAVRKIVLTPEGSERFNILDSRRKKFQERIDSAKALRKHLNRLVTVLESAVSASRSEVRIGKDFVTSKLAKIERVWSRENSSDFSHYPWMKAVARWRIMCLGMGFWNFWLPSLLPPVLHSDLFTVMHGWRLELGFRPRVLGWFYHLCWFSAIAAGALTLKAVAHLVLP